MADKKDYYEILGLKKGASDDAIKQAFRKLAREHHPDVAKDKTEAERRFKEINEAYQVLGDPEKKRMYDQFGHAGGGPNGFNSASGGPGGFGGFGGRGGQGGQWGPFSYSYTTTGGDGGGAGGAGFEGFDPFDAFEDLFNFGGGRRQPKRGKSLHYEMHVSFYEAVHGVEKNIRTEAGELKIKIPAGISNGNQMRFAGKGMPGPDNLPAGDLFVTFYVDMPREFERDGETIGVSKEISFVQAVLGDNIEVPVVDPEKPSAVGSAVLKVPAGTQSGARFRVRGKGMPSVNNANRRGDVIVQVIVNLPSKISRRQRELLEEYKRVS